MLRVIRPCVALAAAIVLLSVAGCTTASNPEQAARDISVKYLTDLAHGKDLQSYLCKGISGTGDWTRGVGLQNEGESGHGNKRRTGGAELRPGGSRRLKTKGVRLANHSPQWK
jgi:hypothetical protein